MNAQRLRSGLAAILDQEGLTGCALVDLDTGMVLQRAGADEQVPLVEAATDYWRLCGRQAGVFGTLGPPRALVVIHELARITIVCCGDRLLLVTLSVESRSVDWERWKRSVHRLQQTIRGL